jgi:hypothetical protein
MRDCVLKLLAIVAKLGVPGQPVVIQIKISTHLEKGVLFSTNTF